MASSGPGLFCGLHLEVYIYRVGPSRDGSSALVVGVVSGMTGKYGERVLLALLESVCERCLKPGRRNRLHTRDARYRGDETRIRIVIHYRRGKTRSLTRPWPL